MLFSRLVGTGKSTDAAPSKSAHELDGLFAGERRFVVQPVARSDVPHADEAHSQQVGGLVWKSGVFVDDLGDRRGRFADDSVYLFAHGRVIHQIGFEDEAKRGARVGDIRVPKIDCRLHAVLVVDGGGDN